jgi:hypothetical protein
LHALKLLETVWLGCSPKLDVGDPVLAVWSTPDRHRDRHEQRELLR